MRNVFEEYLQGMITWNEAFAVANPTSHTDYWADQMESLAVNVAGLVMTKLSCLEDSNGKYFKE